MPLRYYANAPASSLANSCTALATNITLASVTGLPVSYPYTLIIDRGTATEEVVTVTGAAGTTLTVTRGSDNTTAFVHSAGAEVVHGITARDIREVNSHANTNAGVHGVSGALVGTTDTQTLTNKTLASPTLTGNPTAPTPAASNSDTSLATTAFVKAVLLAAHPVGDIKFSTVNVNPGTYLGGTWVPWGSGRVPVGVDTSQAEFNAAEGTGGAKTHTLSVNEMPSHNHGGATGTDFPDHAHQFYRSAIVNGGVAGGGALVVSSEYLSTTSGATERHTHSISSQGGGQPHNNLQPYITCYMFKRTA